MRPVTGFQPFCCTPFGRTSNSAPETNFIMVQLSQSGCNSQMAWWPIMIRNFSPLGDVTSNQLLRTAMASAS
jgi:hypothetical protein